MVLRSVVVAAIGSFLAATTPAAARTASGTVLYEQRDCYAGATRTNVPVEGVPIVIHPPIGKKIEDHLDERGHFSVPLPGVARGAHLKASLIFVGDGLKIQPDPRTADIGDTPYSIDIDVHPGPNGKIVLTREGEAGVANVWTVMRRAAEYVKKHGPKQLPPVTVALKYTSGFAPTNDVGVSHYRSEDARIRILDRENSNDLHDEWEQFTIVHEFGHHVLFSFAPPATKSGDKHNAADSYPDRPGLALSEGFAHALAAVVLGKPDLGYRCKPFIHLASKHQPDPEPESQA